MSASAAAASPGSTSKANERQRSPSPMAPNAELCRSGESEWATGLPITPTMWTPGPTSARACAIVRDTPGGDSGETTGLRQLFVRQLLGVRVGERHDAVLLDEHEVEPRSLWRVDRRGEGIVRRHADRG